MKKKVIIMGLLDAIFTTLTCFFRDNEEYEVVAFTATQIPNIEGRKYPAELQALFIQMYRHLSRVSVG